MAKKANKVLETQLSRLEATQAELMASITADQQRMQQQVSARGEQGRTSQMVSVPKGETKLITQAKTKTQKSRQIAVDLGGGFVAQASTELINWGVRATARWAPDGWIAANADALQGAPHFILGLGIYIAEMASRKNAEMPSTTREVISEASKLFSQLGFSNLVRTMRVRFADGKQKDVDLDALKAERANLQARLDALQAKGK